MPSKTSNPKPKKPLRPWKDKPSCSESELELLAGELASELGPRDRVILEGDLGAGKSTFARALLLAFGVEQLPEGSPTFAIAHEYRAPRGEMIHLDLYRLSSEDELDGAGVPDYFWNREAAVLVEWLSLVPEFESRVLEGAEGVRNWLVRLDFTDVDDKRRVKIDSV